MRLLQRLLKAVQPTRVADSMEAESRQWKIRCCTCGAERSVWDAGGVRSGAASAGKRTLIWCSRCSPFRRAAVVREAA